MKKLTIIILAVVLSACIPQEEDIPESATCTADGWRVDYSTGEIITNDAGSAIQCTFN